MFSGKLILHFLTILFVTTITMNESYGECYIHFICPRLESGYKYCIDIMTMQMKVKLHFELCNYKANFDSVYSLRLH